MKSSAANCAADCLKDHIKNLNKKEKAKLTSIDITPFVTLFQIEDEQPEKDAQ